MGDHLLKNAVKILLDAFFAGIFIGIAGTVYLASANPVMVFLCVMVFILSGFEHCIANMYYFSAADLWNTQTLLMTLLMTLGNSVGGNFFAALVKLTPAWKIQVSK